MLGGTVACSRGKILKSWYSLVASEAVFLYFLKVDRVLADMTRETPSFS